MQKAYGIFLLCNSVKIGIRHSNSSTCLNVKFSKYKVAYNKDNTSVEATGTSQSGFQLHKNLSC